MIILNKVPGFNFNTIFLLFFVDQIYFLVSHIMNFILWIKKTYRFKIIMN
jgi:hypothetical protein